MDSAGGFDPVPRLRDIAKPGLWVFGGRDHSIPVALSVQRLGELASEGHDYRVVLLPQADHLPFDRTRVLPGFEASLFDRLAEWFKSGES